VIRSYLNPPQFSVIPQNFLFALARKEIYAACCAGSKRIDVNAMYHRAHLVSRRKKPNGIPDKIAFPRLKAGKSDFSGMTGIYEG
jgi:hypothetical protein